MSGAGATGSSTDGVSKLVKLLAEDREFTSVEIAETLWLATKMEVATPDAVETKRSPQAPLPSANLGGELPKLELPSLPPPTTPQVNIAAPAPQTRVLPPKTLPVWLADPPMLTDVLAIIRALRPLLQKVDAGVGRRLDEPATVENIARTRLVLPVLQSEQRPYFDIILVVDRGSSMHIWQRLVKDAVRILKRYGVFWNVQVFDLAVDPEAKPPEESVLLVSNPQRPGHRPSELIDQQGQRIAVLLSDCAGPYWWDSTLLPMLHSWGAMMPTMVWQVLPGWMWKRTALGRGTAVALGNDVYGGANQWLKVQLQERDESDDLGQRISLPVVTSDAHDLARWSLMVAGDRRQVTPGFLLPLQGGTVPRSRSYEDIAQDRAQQLLTAAPDTDPAAALNQALNTLASERVERFLELASPEAQRLIMLLAAAPVVTLPVVRLIRDAMLSEVTSPLPVAEVFLSGLLQRLPGQPASDLEQAVQDAAEQAESDELDQVPLETQDLVQYDFAPGVRSVLLTFLPPVDTIDVVNSVSAAVERRWNQVSTEDFRAFLTDPTVQVAEELQGLRSFASVTADILEQLGGDYAQFAQALRQGAEPAQPTDTGGFDSSDFPLQDIEYDVAEFINLPSLESFEFIEAHFEEDIFPPPLQTDEFIVTTCEIQPDAETTQGLETFNFIVATIQPRQGQQQPTGWEISRQEQQAYRLREPLPGIAPLEMVAIPGGTFLMGSPDDEPERFDDESPQHEVTVPPFFMGSYPTTQAQWRVVAAMPQVEQGLDPDPSHFKGDNRPVERVSWYDALEFCARLSAHTGRQYRLPTEAEWEYACRAGTTTPFHFGETISSELANYQGSTIYADGPTGEDATETTSIDHFGIANAFGLSDMHGNVLEWCQDHWHSNYEGAPTDGSAWLSDDNGVSRVSRGGSWDINPRYCRSAIRDGFESGDDVNNVGFRVCCPAPRAL